MDAAKPRSAQVGMALSRSPSGLSAPLVRVEVHLSGGLPLFALVGLPEAVVRESKERVRSAILNGGFDFPSGRITINLSPAHLPKEGGRFDLPMALGILAASGQIDGDVLAGREFYGELSLSGELREIPKLLPSLVAAVRDRREAIVPIGNALEARLAANERIRLGASLAEVCRALRLDMPLPSAAALLDRAPARPAGAETPAPDLADVHGQPIAKRALEVAAAGEHGLLLIGTPGTGKTLLAQRLPGLLPPLSAAESIEVASLQSAAGLRPVSHGRRPFRAPQHTASVAAFVGGATRPGEMSLAHRGILFLDELPEFARDVLESLREPLESGSVVVSRLKAVCEYPARFQLIAAMNPCPCGYSGDERRHCRCTPAIVARYRGRLSGPLIDRIDMHVQLQPMAADELVRAGERMGHEPPAPESSAVVARRVATAQALARARQGKLNARLTPAETAVHCRLGREASFVMCEAIRRLGLSARAHQRMLKVARTCADLDGVAEIDMSHVGEAALARTLDRAIC